MTLLEKIKNLNYVNIAGKLREILLGLAIKGQYTNNTTAKAGGLKVGDIYSIPIAADRSILAVVV